MLSSGRKSLGVSGKEVTPVLLAEFARYTAGASVEVNRRTGGGERSTGRTDRVGDRQGTGVIARGVSSSSAT